MGRGPTNENANMYFQARKKAATYNERLWSREGAAELLGISVSTLADYELGNTKVVPVDNWYFTGEQRTGCCVCGFGCHLEPVPNRLQRLRTSDNDKHRRMCEGCLQIKNHGMTYEQALNYAGIPTEEVQEDE